MQRCALLALLCGFWCGDRLSCLNVINMVDAPILRTAEEAEQRYLRATPFREPIFVNKDRLSAVRCGVPTS